MTKTQAACIGSVLGCWIAVTGCDEETKKEEAAVPIAAPTPSPSPAAIPPVPEPAPEAKTPTKKLEECSKGPQITFDNPDIEAHIRMKAQKPEGEITTADLGRVTSVNFSRVSLDTLDTCLFHHMRNLKEVFLGPGKVWDLSPLAGLSQLEAVRIAGNPVEDLSPLGKMKNMDRLDIGDTKVKDISAASGWTKLTEVTLDGSLVEDISALAAAKDLETLGLKRTQVKDVSALKDLKKLETVFIAESPLASDIGATGALAQNGVKIVTD